MKRAHIYPYMSATTISNTHDHTICYTTTPSAPHPLSHPQLHTTPTLTPSPQLQLAPHEPGRVPSYKATPALGISRWTMRLYPEEFPFIQAPRKLIHVTSTGGLDLPSGRLVSVLIIINEYVNDEGRCTSAHVPPYIHIQAPYMYIIYIQACDESRVVRGPRGVLVEPYMSLYNNHIYPSLLFVVHAKQRCCLQYVYMLSLFSLLLDPIDIFNSLSDSSFNYIITLIM